jgi:uncharacterized delta-60 repeat protein
VRRTLAVLAAIAMLTLVARPAVAASGDRDSTFSGDGFATTSFGAAGGDAAYGVAVQAGRKVVVLGSSDFNDGALIRFTADGGLDHTFSGDGKLTFPIGTSEERMGLALQPDGKVLVAGRVTGTSPSDRDFFVERFRVGGAVDAGFGGMVTTDFAGGDDAASSVVVQPDGKIVVGGQAEIGGTFRPALVRYTSLGGLDHSFGGGDGKVTTAVFDDSRINAVAVQADGKIVAVGSAGRDETSSDFLVLRYRPNGTLDPTFSGDGRATVDFAIRDSAEAVALQSNGAIVVAGDEFPTGSNANWALARFHGNGTLDHTFSTDGKLVTRLGDRNDFLTGVVVQGSGRIVGVGDSLDGTSFMFRGALVRYKPGGALDHSFSGDGKVLDTFGSEGILQGVRNYPGDRLVAGVMVRESGSDFDAGAARYLAG